MRYQPLPAKFHASRRQKLAQAIGPGALAIIDTADVLSRAGDFEYPFRPDSNFYYLTGIDESEAVLVLAPGHPNERLREILFIRETNDFIALWAGRRLTQKGASDLSGIKTVLWLDELEDILSRMADEFATIYLNNHPTLSPGPLTPSDRRAVALRTQLPTHEIKCAVKILGELRTIKAPEEVAQIRRAVAITGAGLAKARSQLKPGLPEYALEAELTAEFTRQGAIGLAFSPIVAAGKNATIIHYSTDAAELKSGETVLFDVGAEAGYYCADISRVVPVGAKFSGRQQAVYDAVLRAQQTGIALHKPGTTILAIDEAMRQILVEELVKLGELTAKEASGPEAQQHLRKYYAHISHHIGLDAHDTGSPRTKLEPGMVVTCEPGLYLQKEGIGVRLEDVILITETGYEVLSQDIPK